MDVPPNPTETSIQYRIEGNSIVILPIGFSGWLDGDHMLGRHNVGSMFVIARRGANVLPGSLAGYWTGVMSSENESSAGLFELQDNGQGSVMFAPDNILPVRYSQNGNQVMMEFPLSYAGTTIRLKYSATINGTTLTGTLSSPAGNGNMGTVTLTKVARPGPAPRMKSEWSKDYFSPSAPSLTVPASPSAISGGGALSNRWAKPVNTDFAGFSFTLADQPGARMTHLVGINDSGVIVGYYVSFFPNNKLRETAAFPFIISRGQMTVLHGPIFDPRTFGLGDIRYANTTPLAINNKGQVLLMQSLCAFVDTSCDNGNYYLYNVNDATVRPIGRNFRTAEHPNETFQAWYFAGLNDQGEILGRMVAYQSNPMSFPFYGTPILGPPGSTQAPTAPGSFTRLPECSKDEGLVMLGINSRDEVIGVCPETSSEPQSAVLYNGGKLMRFSYPGSAMTFVTGISNSGLVSGYYQAVDAVKYQGFLFDGSQFFPLVPPGSAGGQLESSQAIAVNSSGQVVGTYKDAAPPRQNHVYIASPRSPFPQR